MSFEAKAAGIAAIAGILVVGLSFGGAAIMSALSTPHTPPTVASQEIPQDTDISGEIIEGGQYFQRSCAGCHGQNAQGLSDAPGLHNEDLSDADITDIITHGNGRMPPFGRTYTAFQIKTLAQYIRTLK